MIKGEGKIFSVALDTTARSSGQAIPRQKKNNKTNKNQTITTQENLNQNQPTNQKTHKNKKKPRVHCSPEMVTQVVMASLSLGPKPQVSLSNVVNSHQRVTLISFFNSVSCEIPISASGTSYHGAE